MAKWTRTNGYDEEGRRTILITENEPTKKPEPEYKVPWFVKLDWKIMKVMFWGALITTGILALFIRILSGVPF